MDVKAGSGAFMEKTDDARDLARSLVLVANGAGLPTTALLTDMNEPLASAAGNGLEVAYALAYLTGAHRQSRFHGVTMALAAEMLVLGGLASDREDGLARAENALVSGRAAEVFAAMVKALGGPGDLLENPSAHLPRAVVIRPVYPERPGIVQAIATRDLGVAVVLLGGGRTRPEDEIDHGVGLDALATIGARVDGDTPLAFVHARDDSAADAAARAVVAAYRVGDETPSERPLVIERVEDEKP